MSYVALIFQENDFLEAQAQFINFFAADNPTGETPDGLLYDCPEPTLWVDLATVTIPALAGLIAIWLGKGKQVTVKRSQWGSKETITIRNHDERSTLEILKTFLNDG